MRRCGVKKCTKCKAWRYERSFSPDKRTKDGLQSACKLCKSRATYAYKKHKHDEFNAFYDELNQHPEFHDLAMLLEK